jgi:ATP phosphoribosyltransferase
MADYVKFALPKGNLMAATACLLQEAGLGFDGYSKDSRLYHLTSSKHPDISAKIFQEKDIPIQVSIGNYDIGICGLDWIEELLVKFPESPLIKLTDLEYDNGELFLASSVYGDIRSVKDLQGKPEKWKIVSEYPNMCERAAIDLRLRQFKIFPVWGAAEIYPPEDADLVITRAQEEAQLKGRKLVPLKSILKSSAFLVINRESWQTKNLGRIIGCFNEVLARKSKPWLNMAAHKEKFSTSAYHKSARRPVKLALPDGHQMKPTAEFLRNSGIVLDGYDEGNLQSRPTSNMDWLEIKVIRPQDMPIQVANSNFDLAITGIDWLNDHRYRFPSSPVEELVDLNFGGVRIVAVVSNSVPADNIIEMRKMVSSGKISPLRVASEYVNIADYYLHNNHIKSYKVIPTWGATEALIPEDADMLIENTQTGKTLAAHNLKIIDVLFYSTAYLIGNKESSRDARKINGIMYMKKVFSKTVGATK